MYSNGKHQSTDPNMKRFQISIPNVLQYEVTHLVQLHSETQCSALFDI